MEKIVNKRMEEYLQDFKKDIKQKVTELQFEAKDFEKINELLEYVYEYKRLVFQASELTRPKREAKATVVTVIEEQCRCKALRVSGEPCTRRKKINSDFCGTHDKEHTKSSTEPAIKQVEVTAEEMDGIVYYIDREGNIYHTEDIMSGKAYPRIIARIHRKEGVTESNGMGTRISQLTSYPDHCME